MSQPTPDRNWIWITPKWPFPAQDGARQANQQMVQSLVRKGDRVHLVSFIQAGDLPPDVRLAQNVLGVKAVTVLRRFPAGQWRRLWTIFLRPWSAITLLPYQSREAKTVVLSLLEQNPTAVVVFDGLHAGAWWAQLTAEVSHKLALRAVYRAHNVEKEIWVRAARESRFFLLRWFLLLQARAVGRIEQKLVSTTRWTFAVSPVDAQEFRRWVPLPTDRVQVAAIGMRIVDYQSTSNGVSLADDSSILGRADLGESLRLLFVGKLDWPPNRAGLSWFLQTVWPQVSRQRSDVLLTVVGSGQSDWLTPFLSLERVRFLGRVESIASAYSEADLCLVPIFFGSGTRVKAIEASLYQKALLSTALGVEGIGLEAGHSYLSAETAEEWIDILLKIQRSSCDRIAKNALHYVSSAFDPDRIAQTLSDRVFSATE